MAGQPGLNDGFQLPLVTGRTEAGSIYFTISYLFHSEHLLALCYAQIIILVLEMEK